MRFCDPSTHHTEHVVMTPAKRGACTIIQVERVPASMLDRSRGPSYGGLVVNESGQQHASSTAGRHADLQLEFKCWLIDKVTSASHSVSLLHCVQCASKFEISNFIVATNRKFVGLNISSSMTAASKRRRRLLNSFATSSNLKNFLAIMLALSKKL